MSDNPSPFQIHPDEHIEARITAWVLGEASPFEAAELQSLIEKSPELKLFHNRIRTLHTLLPAAEDTSGTGDEEWKLPPGKKIRLTRTLGGVPEITRLPVEKESRIRRASFRAAFGIAACVVVTFFTIRLIPWQHEAEAVIEVKPRSRAMMSEKPLHSMTPQFFGTEFERIKSRHLMEQVVDNLGLTSRWNTDKETALKKLRDSVTTKNIKGTDLISIRVRQPNEQDANEITRELTEEYQNYRNELAGKSQEKSLNELKKAIREQEDAAEESRKVLTTISRTKDIAYYGDRGAEGGIEESQGAAYVMQESNRLEGEKVQLETQIESLLKYDSNQLLTYASGLDVPDNIVKSLYPQKLELKRQIDGLKASGLADNHPSIKTNQRVLDNMEQDLNEGVINLRARLQGQLETSKERLAKVETIRENAKLENLERSIDTQDYVDAKRKFETDQALLEQMKLKLISQETNARAKHDSVVIHDLPPAPVVGSEIASKTESPASTPAPTFAPAEPSLDGSATSRRRESAPQDAQPYPNRSLASAESAPQIHIGGQVRTPGSQEFREGLTLGDVIDAAGGPTQFGSSKRVRVSRDGEASTYDISKNNISKIELQPGDTIEMPQKTWMGCGASRDEITKNEASQEKAKTAEKAPLDPVADAVRKKIQTAEQSQLATMAPAWPSNSAGLRADGRLDGDLRKNQEAGESALARKPSAPASTFTREIQASAGLSPIDIPVPSVDLAPNEENSFGDEADFGKGWGGKDRKLGLSPQSEKEAHKLGDLDDSIRMNPAVDRDQSGMADDVRRKLYEAQGNFDLGKFDEAKKAYEDTLRIDPYNSAARRGMEKIATTKSDYYRAAYDQTRAELLMQVDDGWELSAPADKDVHTQARSAVSPDFSDTDPNWSLANRFSDGLDTDGYGKTKGYAFYSGAGSEGFNFSFQETPETPAKFGAGLKAGAEVTTRSGNASNLKVIREFTYPIEYEPAELPNFKALDSPFPVTPATPNQARITTKFIEISQANNEELGFDWIPKSFKTFEGKLVPIDIFQEIPATQEPFSTFSLNISDASFQLARTAIEKGERPDPASIKPEQFYNAIDYGDPAPSSREPVAAAIDQTAHPVIPGRNLVRIAVRTASTGRSAAQPLRLTLLVDQSGSMVREDRRAAMETAMEQLATLLTEQDRITVIGFSRTPRLLADSLPGDQANKLPDLINQTASEGGTNLEQAINLASELALRHKLAGAQNRIVLFTDGAANLGNADPERLSEKIETLRQQGLAFDIAGIGTNDLNDNLLAELARHGNGRYYLVGENTASSLAAQLAGAFRPAAENVKVQVKLNPERVGNYKLIGFEKDRLKTEDFRNDSIDAAELAADEAGVAMYQIETLPEGTGEIGEVSVRFRDTASGEMVERSWTIPHDPTAPAFDKADPKTQLATLSLLAAQELQGGPSPKPSTSATSPKPSPSSAKPTPTIPKPSNSSTS